MSLLDVIKNCDDGNSIKINDLMDLPFIDLIVNGKFNVENKTLDELMVALKTYNYLNIDSKIIMNKLLWELGRNEKKFLEFFDEKSDENKFTIKHNIDKVFEFELRKLFGDVPIDCEQLNVRFKYVTVYNCIKYKNMKLLEWAVLNEKLVKRF